MKFRYGYRTKDNQRCEGSVSARSREDVYSILKKSGIKPYFVELDSGLLNRVFYTLLKMRWIIVFVLFAIVCGALVYVWNMDDASVVETSNSIDSRFDDMTRRQIIGDQVIITRGIRSGWSDVFAGEGERFLASFAIPGVAPAVRSTSVKAIEEALTREIEVVAEDSLEARQIKSMVEGIKKELREFLIAGGSIKEFGDCLVARQEEEIMYRNRAKNELEMALHRGANQSELERMWEERNVELRKMGIKHVEMPGQDD